MPDYEDKPTPPTPPEPSGDQQIIDIQKWIIDAYGLPIQVTGEFDKQTKLYITMAYQMELNANWLSEEKQISVDGIFGLETKDATPELGIGDEGDLVSLVQSMLYCRGYILDYGVSGEYDDSTANAVRTFQANQGFTGKDLDGVYGPKTGYRLFN